MLGAMACLRAGQRAALSISLAACATALVGCGARTDLDAARSALGSGGAAVPSAASGSGGGGKGGGGGGGEGGAPDEPCLFVAADPPLEIVTAAHALVAPSMVALEAGGPGDGAPARVALQFLDSDPNAHPVNRLARVRVADPWPAGVTLETEPMVFGVESHSYAVMAHAPGALEELAVAWHGDPGNVGRTAFRVLDIPSWTPLEPVAVSFEGSTALALAPGRGTGPFGAGYQGDGYGIAWREYVDTMGEPLVRARAGVLDPSGALRLGPHTLGIEVPPPGYTPALIWSGETYLLATAYRGCGGKQGCPAPLAVERIRPASGDAFDDSGIELAWGHEPAAPPSRPALERHGGRVWVAWAEGRTIDGPQRIVWRALDAQGQPADDVEHAQDVARPASRLELRAGDFGLGLGWMETKQGDWPAALPGASTLVVSQLHESGTAVTSLVVPVTRHAGGPPSFVPLARPRGLLATWSGRSATGESDVVHLALLRCLGEERRCASSASCLPGEYCQQLCCGQPGECRPRPTVCDTGGPGVTACGGASFTNDCEAAAAGLSVPSAGCPAAVYQAKALPTGSIDRVVVTKIEPANDLCVRLQLAVPWRDTLGIDASGLWGVDLATVHAGESNCFEPTFDKVAHAQTGAGTVTLLPGGTSCPTQVSLDVTLYFDEDAPWVPSLAGMLASDLPVAGCN
jgi:hypothetical protein